MVRTVVQALMQCLACCHVWERKRVRRRCPKCRSRDVEVLRTESGTGKIDNNPAQ